VEIDLRLLLDLIRHRGYTPELALKGEDDNKPLTTETLIMHREGSEDITWEISYADLRTIPDKLWKQAINHRLPDAT